MKLDRALLLSLVAASQPLVVVNAQQPRITNGQPVTAGNYPFFTFNKFGNAAGCGATIIHSDIILTAAHCRRAFIGRAAYVGPETNFGFEGSAEFHEDETFVVHPQYNATNLHNDIMVVKLQTSSNLPVVQLNRDPQRQIVGTSMMVIGFGDTTFRGDLSPNLLQTQVTGFDFEQCVQIHLEQDPTVTLDQTAQFCALGTEGRDACDGDSGGPILLIDDNKEVIQMGVISSGLGCGDEGIPAVYARITTYVDWIDGQVCALSSNPPAWCSTISSDFGSGNSGGGAVDTTAETSDETLPPSVAFSSRQLCPFIRFGATVLLLIIGF